uniref:Uncharacterized protein n=1 Tax=Lotus japonicus TaxID=34305 RepID=I3SUY3_LOTJA|nr:unknown [Lotus japonicus]
MVFLAGGNVYNIVHTFRFPGILSFMSCALLMKYVDFCCKKKKKKK